MGDLTDRLMARGDTGLQRVATPDGGEVYKGPTARRALRALGARAFTVDRTIIVDDDFDPSNPEDAALYAHEVHHQMESGGMDDGHGAHDAEEAGARAIERMVFHRATKGEGLGAIMRDVRSGNVPKVNGMAQTVLRELRSASAELEPDDPMHGYMAMKAQGKSHEIIVQELAKMVLERLDEMQEDQHFRASAGTDFL